MRRGRAKRDKPKFEREWDNQNGFVPEPGGVKGLVFLVFFVQAYQRRIFMRLLSGSHFYHFLFRMLIPNLIIAS